MEATVPSCSAFYQRMRQSVSSSRPAGREDLSTPVRTPGRALPQQRLGETMSRLAAIAERREHGSSSGTPARLAGSVAVAGGAVRAESRAPPESSSGGRTDAGSGLTEAEVAFLRVVEIDAKVALFANVNVERDPNAFTRICDEATVKVFARHVVFSRPDGGPVVELVIAELVELTEDDTKSSLQFHLEREAGSAIIEVVCRNATARSTLYKLVCAKRNTLEAS